MDGQFVPVALGQCLRQPDLRCWSLMVLERTNPQRYFRARNASHRGRSHHSVAIADRGGLAHAEPANPRRMVGFITGQGDGAAHGPWARCCAQVKVRHRLATKQAVTELVEHALLCASESGALGFAQCLELFHQLGFLRAKFCGRQHVDSKA